jgi:hypothetical protein
MDIHKPKPITGLNRDALLVEAGAPETDNGIYAYTLLSEQQRKQFYRATRATAGETRAKVAMDWANPWKHTSNPVMGQIMSNSKTIPAPIKGYGYK